MRRRTIIGGITFAVVVIAAMVFVGGGFYQPAKHPYDKGTEPAAWDEAHDYLVGWRHLNLHSHTTGHYDELSKNWYFEGDYLNWEGRIGGRYICCVYLGKNKAWYVEYFSYLPPETPEERHERLKGKRGLGR